MQNNSGYQRWKRDAVIACGAGVAAAVVMALAVFALGHVSGGEARVLVEAILPTSRFLCSAVMTACATILALMLTMLGMTINAEQDLNDIFYFRIKQVAFYNMLVLVASTCFLVIHCIPITKSDQIPSWWYSTAYYFVLSISALLGGALIAIVAMLYASIRDVIRAFGLDQNTGLRQTTQSESTENGSNSQESDEG